MRTPAFLALMLLTAATILGHIAVTATEVASTSFCTAVLDVVRAFKGRAPAIPYRFLARIFPSLSLSPSHPMARSIVLCCSVLRQQSRFWWRRRFALGFREMHGASC